MSAPGWYPDPAGTNQQRYFDGKSWTENYAPFPPTPPVVGQPNMPLSGNGQPAKTGLPVGLKVGLVVAVGVLLFVLMSNSGDDDKRNEVSSSSAASSNSSFGASTSRVESVAVADAPAPVGSTVRDGKFEFQVLGVERGATSINDVFGPEVAKGEFFTVKLRVTNVGDNARSFSATNQKLIINGNKYKATSIMDNGWMEDINPGLAIEASATFDIPPGAAPTAIECHDSMFSGGALLAI